MSVTTKLMCSDSKGASSKDNIRWFIAMTNHYVSGLYGSSGVLLHQLQRVIDEGTQAVTGSHDAMIQFCPATKRTSMYQYVILNVWPMPCTLPATHTKKQKGTQVHKKHLTYLTATTLLTNLTMTNLKVYCGQSHH